MNFAYSLRVGLGILLVVFFSLLSSYRLLVQSMRTDLRFIGLDEVSQNDRRFERIKENLPSHGVIGYRPNGQPTSSQKLQLGNLTDLRNWLLTQYALAPVIVSPTEGHSLVICNYGVMTGVFLPREDPTITGYGAGWKIIDFGNGVKLIKPELE